MNENEKLNVPFLIIDDDVNFISEFIKRAAYLGLPVIHRTNFDEMKEVLNEAYDRISCVVLDVKCFIHKGQPKEDEGFIGVALEFLARNFPDLPKFILTGDSGSLDKVKTLNPHIKNYFKDYDETNKLLEEILELTRNLDYYKVREKYSDIYDIFNSTPFLSRKQSLLNEVLISSDKSDSLADMKTLAKARNIIEDIFFVINQKRPAILPNSCFENSYGKKKVKFKKAINHLTGNRNRDNQNNPSTDVFINQPIEAFLNCLYGVSSDLGSHENSPDQHPLYAPTKYTLKACTAMLCELILWSKSVIK